ncbi:MAG: hypothetical protein ABR950_07375 [Candidatus Dormibacteria bacterium]
MGATAETGSIADLLEWADSECRDISSSTVDALATRMWRVRLSLEARQRHEADPGALRRLAERIAAIRQAEDDLTSVSAILQTMGGPITWREVAGQVVEPAI